MGSEGGIFLHRLDGFGDEAKELKSPESSIVNDTTCK
jgi:hypothetical protein